MKELVKFISQALVDFPDKVEVTEIIGEQTSVIELRVAKEDMGKVIGKQGRIAQAIRTILSAASAKAHKRAVLEILGNYDPKKNPAEVTIKEKRVRDWLSKGAKPTLTVSNLLKTKGIEAKVK